MSEQCDLCGQLESIYNNACPQHRMWRFERERDEAQAEIERLRGLVTSHESEIEELQVIVVRLLAAWKEVQDIAVSFRNQRDQLLVDVDLWRMLESHTDCECAVCDDMRMAYSSLHTARRLEEE